MYFISTIYNAMRRQNGKKLQTIVKDLYHSTDVCLSIFFQLAKGLRRLIYRVTENKYNVSFNIYFFVVE